MSKGSITINNETKLSVPRALFQSIKDEALGANYELSLVIALPAEMKRYNLMYRNKNEPTDILSFPLESDKGEIYLCPEEADRMAPKFDRDPHNFFVFLFIHGCVHLKGYDHGSRMEQLEEDLRRKFKV